MASERDHPPEPPQQLSRPPAASSVDAPVSFCPCNPTGVAEYVEAVLGRHLSLPGTLGRVRPVDRRCAQSLYRRGIPWATVDAALLLATARRTFRGQDRPPLPAVRALHYFLPVIEELLDQPLDPGYASYLARRLQPWMRTNRSP